MKVRKVKGLMIPLSDYATVSESDSLSKAIRTLKQSQVDQKCRHGHRAVLVFGSNGCIVGKLGYRDILKALEPKYRQFEHAKDTGAIGLSRFGFNYEFLHSLVKKLDLWDESMEELVKRTPNILVKDAMYTPSQGEYVNESAPVAEAVHQFILGCHQSLLVLNNVSRVVGVIRLVDVFDLISQLTD